MRKSTSYLPTPLQIFQASRHLYAVGISHQESSVVNNQFLCEIIVSRCPQVELQGSRDTHGSAFVGLQALLWRIDPTWLKMHDDIASLTNGKPSRRCRGHCPEQHPSKLAPAHSYPAILPSRPALRLALFLHRLCPCCVLAQTQ